jgi:hypothetical protein
MAVDHRGIRYEIKRAIGKNEWVWIIYTPTPKQGNITGPWDGAVYAAVRAIDRWCDQHPADCEPPIR